MGSHTRTRTRRDRRKPTFWDVGGMVLSLTSLISLAFELGYVVVSEDESGEADEGSAHPDQTSLLGHIPALFLSAPCGSS